MLLTPVRATVHTAEQVSGLADGPGEKLLRGCSESAREGLVSANSCHCGQPTIHDGSRECANSRPPRWPGMMIADPRDQKAVRFNSKSATVHASR